MASLSSGDAAAIIICSTVGAVALLVGLFLAFTGRCRGGCRQRQSANPFALRVSSAFAAEAAAYDSANVRARAGVQAASIAAPTDVLGRQPDQNSAVMDVAAPSSPSWAAGGVESSHPQPFSPSGEMTNPALPSPPASLTQPHSLADAPQAVSVTVLGLSAGGLSHKAEEARVAEESTVSGASSTVSADCALAPAHASETSVAGPAMQSKPAEAAHHPAASEPAAPTPSPVAASATASDTETVMPAAERAAGSMLSDAASTTAPAATAAALWTDGPATPAGGDASTTGSTTGSSAESAVTVHDTPQAVLSSGSGRSQPLLRVSSLDHATLFSYAQQAAVRSPEAEPAPDGVGAVPQPLATYRDAAPQTSSRNVTRGRRYSNAPLPVGSPGGRIADLDHSPGCSPSDGAASSGLSSRRRSVVAPIDTGDGEGLVSVGARSGAAKAPVSRPVVPPEQVKIADHDDLDAATLVGVVVTPTEARSRALGLGRAAGAGSRSFTDKSAATAGGTTAGCEEVHAYDQDIDVDHASVLGLEGATAVHPDCDASKGERVYMMGVLSPQASSTSASGSARRA